LKKVIKETLSRITINKPKATTWVAVALIMAAAKTDQTKIGNLPHVIPGARRQIVVVKKFRPPKIDDRPKVRKAKRNNN
jgi:hypothetical protein